MKKVILILAVIFSINSLALAQDQQIDASKPTNFYSLLDNTFENTNSPGQNVFGYRGKLMLAPSEKHLVLAELPLLYNDKTQKAGIGDIRARYFYLPYKNYDKLLGAFGPSIDVFAPTGNAANGLGSGRWTVSPGITAGLMAADWIQFFPILSYQYGSKPVNNSAEQIASEATHGMTFQVLTPIVFSEKFFMQVTPIFRMNNFNDERQNRFVQEATAVYSITPTMQISGFYNGNFKDNIHQVSAGLTIFL